MEPAEPTAGATQLDLSVDLTRERPSNVAQELRPNALLRRVALGVGGAIAAVLLVVWATSGSEEAPRKLRPVLGPSLPVAVLGLETARMDAITESVEQEKTRVSTRRRSARRASDAEAVPARATGPAKSSSGTSSSGTSRSGTSSSSRLRGLPTLDPEPAPAAAAASAPDTAPAPKSLPSVDAAPEPEPQPAFEPEDSAPQASPS